jgi:hypothetical protein
MPWSWVRTPPGPQGENMQPRYRKSAPEIKKFANEDELKEFMRNFVEAESEFFTEMKKQLKGKNFTGITHEKSSEKRTEALQRLLGKIDKFCPHFSTTMPTFRHFLCPSIGVGCCFECLSGFLPLLMADSSGCDLCSIKQVMYQEISIPIGHGTLTMNLGADWCADIFTKNI